MKNTNPYLPLNEMVVLVDAEGNHLGLMEKMEAHRKGILHLAFSVFIFNTQHKILLHRRAANKYHSSLLWTNACCSHPHPEESVAEAAHRRLFEEMGLRCDLEELFVFNYKADVGNGLTEHEHDHVFLGVTDADPQPNPNEVDACKWVAPEEVTQFISTNPNDYSAWFKIAFPRVMEIYTDRLKKSFTP